MAKSLQLGGRHNGRSTLVEQEEQRQDLGFGTRFNDPNARLINKDGSFNVSRTGQHVWARLNFYHRLITMRWGPFLGLVFAFYVLINVVFTLVYLLIGTEHLVMFGENLGLNQFWQAFFFSTQTLTTVGYGSISPVGFGANALAAVESMTGWLFFALVTGLLYGRFARPVAQIRFSAQAVFAPYLDVNGWMFRIINERNNQLIELSVEVTLSRIEIKADGQRIRKYYALKLERNKVNFFPANWTIVHPITPDSPLMGCTPEQLAESDAEFLILLRATDDTYSQPVHLRYSYRFTEVAWGRKFQPLYEGGEQGGILIDLSRLNDTFDAPLNQ